MSDDLTRGLDRIAEAYEPAANAISGVRVRARRRSIRRRLAAGFTALIVSASAFTGLWAWQRADREPTTTATPSVATPTPPPGIEPLPPVSLSIGLTSQTAAALGDVLARPEGVYVATAGRLFTIDPRTGHAVGTVRADWDPDHVDLAWYGEGTFLGVEGNRVWWFGQDASGNALEIEGAAFGPDTMIADAVFASGLEIWMAVSDRDGDWELRRLVVRDGHPSLDEVPRYPLGQGVFHGDLVGGRYLFVSGAWWDPIDYVDPATGAHLSLVGTIRLDERTGELTPVPVGWATIGWGFVAAAADHVWVSHEGWSGCVLALSLEPCGELAIGGAAVADGRDLWILDGRRLSLVDGLTGTLRGSFELPPEAKGPTRLSAADGHAWVGIYGSGAVYRIDPCTLPCEGPTASSGG